MEAASDRITPMIVAGRHSARRETDLKNRTGYVSTQSYVVSVENCADLSLVSYLQRYLRSFVQHILTFRLQIIDSNNRCRVIPTEFIIVGPRTIQLCYTRLLKMATVKG